MVSYSFLAFGTLVVAASATYRSDRNYQNCWASNRCGGEGECTKGWCGTNGFCCKKDQIANGCLGDGPPGEIHGCVEQAPATAPPGTPCPSSHPFVYRQEHGYDYCCDATVVSSSNSCPGGFTPCPSKPCQSNSAVVPTSTPTAPPITPTPTDGGGCFRIEVCESYCNQWNEPAFTQFIGGSKSDARAACNTDVNGRCIWKGAKKWGECVVKDELIAAWTPTVPPTTVEEGKHAIAMDECSVYRKRRYCRHKADAKKHNCMWVNNQCIASTGAPVASTYTPADVCVDLLRGDCFAHNDCTWSDPQNVCHLSTASAPPTTAGTGAPTTIAHDTCGKYRSNVKDAAARYAARIQCIQQPACKWVGGARRGVCLVK